MSRTFSISKVAICSLAAILGAFIHSSIAQESWTACGSGTNSFLRGVAWNETAFVVVGDNGATVTSADGKNWTNQTSSSHSFISIAWGANKFVALSDSMNPHPTMEDRFGYHQVFSSQYGSSWVKIANGNFPWDKVRYVKNRFFAMNSGLNTLNVSLEGSTWVSLPSDPGIISGIEDIAYGKKMYVMVGGGAFDEINGNLWITFQSMISTSSNCSTWTNRTPADRPILTSVVWGKDKFVAAGFGGRIYTSTNGIVWTRQSSGVSNILQAITYASGCFVVVGDSGTILSSPDGITWTSRISGTSSTLKDISYGNNQFVAVGSNGTILTSAAQTAVTGVWKQTTVRNLCFLSGRTLTYSLPSAAPVSIQLFSLKGRLVHAQLDNGSPTSGIRVVRFPQTIARGWYLVSLRAGEMKVDKGVYFGE